MKLQFIQQQVVQQQQKQLEIQKELQLLFIIITLIKITIDTIGGTAGESRNIDTKVRATIGGKIGTLSNIDTITITITITLATIIVTTSTTSVINKFLHDTGAGVSEFKIRWIRVDGATIIRIIIKHITPLHGSELAEWVGFNKIKW